MTWKYNSEKDNKMWTLKKSDFKQTLLMMFFWKLDD